MEMVAICENSPFREEFISIMDDAGVYGLYHKMYVQPDDEELDPVSSTMEARTEDEEAEEPVSVIRFEYIVAAVAV